jgi:DnaK suppressor protein
LLLASILFVRGGTPPVGGDITHVEKDVERYKERRCFPMLSKKNKDYFKKWLTQRLNESLAKARDSLADISDFKNRPSDEIEEASLSSDTGFALRIRDREAKLIGKIRDALDRLEDGTFGICEECAEEIPLKRLMARPVTTLCIECKKAQEAEERTRTATKIRSMG